MIGRIAIGATVVVGLLTLGVGPALADHGGGHNGETMELSKSEDLVDGEVVTVTLTSFLPGNTVNLVTCYVFPALGPADCNLANYGQHSSDVADDGTAIIDYQVDVIPGSCDQDNPCFIVAADGFGTDANYAAQPVTFAAVEPSADATTDSTLDEAAEDAANEEGEEGGEESTGDAAEEAATEVADEAEDLTDASAEDVANEEAAEDTMDEVAVDAADDADDGGPGWLVPLIIGVVVVGGGGAFVASRNNKSVA